MGWVDKQVSDAVDFVTQDIPNKIEDEIIEPTKEFGSSLDDFVNEQIPGGWYTVAAATGAYFAPEIGFIGNSAETAAASADAAFVAADAASLAAQGLTESQIASTLAASGVEGFVAADAAALASQGLSAEAIAPSLGQSISGSSAFGTTATGAPVVDMSRPVSVDQYGNVVANDTGLVTSTYDDGSTLITDSRTGNVVGGTDFNQQPFSVNNGVGTYAGGELLGGTPETTFGGNLADPKDVKSLLDYNAAYADTGVSISDAQRALKLGQSLLGSQPQVAGQPQQQKQVRPTGGVDYSPTLNLLQSPRVSTPNVYSLLG